MANFSGHLWPEWIETLGRVGRRFRPCISPAIYGRSGLKHEFEGMNRDRYYFSGHLWPEWIETDRAKPRAMRSDFSGHLWPEWIETPRHEKGR